jgi:hypothetical protein
VQPLLESIADVGHDLNTSFAQSHADHCEVRRRRSCPIERMGPPLKPLLREYCLPIARWSDEHDHAGRRLVEQAR